MASGREAESYDLACESGSITKFKAGTQYLVGLCTGAQHSVVRVNRASKVRESVRLESVRFSPQPSVSHHVIQQRLLRVQAVLGLVKHPGLDVQCGFLDDFLAVMRGQAVQENRVAGR